MKNCFDKGFKNWVGAMLGSTDKWKMPKQIKSRPIITLLIVVLGKRSRQSNGSQPFYELTTCTLFQVQVSEGISHKE